MPDQSSPPRNDNLPPRPDDDGKSGNGEAPPELLFRVLVSRIIPDGDNPGIPALHSVLLNITNQWVEKHNPAPNKIFEELVDVLASFVATVPMQLMRREYLKAVTHDFASIVLVKRKAAKELREAIKETLE